jgi:hypothetical protein
LIRGPRALEGCGPSTSKRRDLARAALTDRALRSLVDCASRFRALSYR